MDEPANLDLDAYFARIGYDGPTNAGLATLEALHLAHISAVPFENVTIQTGGSISLDAGELFDKIVTRRRGGYCFEQNTFFQQVLTALGFDVIAREGRVRASAVQGQPVPVRPRTHKALEVNVGGRSYNVDVGFGADSPLLPLPLDGGEHEQFGRRYRVCAEGSRRVLQIQKEGDWADLYAVEPWHEPYHVDFEVANWFTSTHPNSLFRLRLVVQRQRPGEQHVLIDRTYMRTCGGSSSTRELSVAEIPALLRDVYGLDVPDGERFLALEGGA